MEQVQQLINGDLPGAPVWTWMAFTAIVVTLLAFDLGVLHNE
jgi:tellurite resistance protein TerC